MSKEGTVHTRAAGVNFSWPHDTHGKPMVLVTMQASELIGLPSYSNVTVGPASVTRFVSEDEVDKGLKESAKQVEQIVAEERELVLGIVKATT